MSICSMLPLTKNTLHRNGMTNGLTVAADLAIAASAEVSGKYLCFIPHCFLVALPLLIISTSLILQSIAKQKPLAVKTAADYGVDLTPRLKTLKVAEPPVRQAGEKVADVTALVEKVKALGIA